MSSEEWWANLLQGSVGATIGLIGLFGVFWLTRRHELARDAATRKAVADRAATERTASGVIQIVEAANQLRLRHSSDNENRTDALCHALTVFAVREAADHPDAAKWAQKQSSEVLRLDEPTSDVRAAPWQAGMISARLGEWSRLRFPADFFPATVDKVTEIDADKPSKTKSEVEKIVDQLDREGQPASIVNIALRMAASASPESTPRPDTPSHEST